MRRKNVAFQDLTLGPPEWGQVWQISFFETPSSGWSFGHPPILSRKLANSGRWNMKPQQKLHAG